MFECLSVQDFLITINFINIAQKFNVKMKRVILKSFWTLILEGLIQLAFAQQSNLLTFSEIMFKPAKANSEFIELFNLSYTDTIDIADMKIKYHTSSPDLIDTNNISFLIPPRSYAVIFEGDYNLTGGIYAGLVPSGAIVLKIDNNAFGSSGMSNSSDRWLYLIDSSNAVIDSIQYSANNSSGISDEKILMTLLNDSSNWSNSKVPNGTPGFKNSVSPFDFDIAFTSFEIITEKPTVTLETEFSGVIKNIGLKSVHDISLELYDIADSADLSGDPFYSELIDSIAAGDSVSFGSNFIFNLHGTHQIIGTVSSNEDMYSANDTIYNKFYVAPKPNKYSDIVINEFMYLPGGDEPEWIELYNNTAEPINLKDWKIKDKTSQIKISNDTLVIDAHSYLVVSEDSLGNFYNDSINIHIKNIPSLNNSGDEIVLVDSLGERIDSIKYSDSWGSIKGVSLERKAFNGSSNDSSNWHTSIALEGATPGHYNSVSPHQYDLSLEKFEINTLYVVYGEPFEAYFTIKNIGLAATESFSLSLYYDLNRNGTGEITELIGEHNFSELLPGDSINFTYIVNDIPLGRGVMISEIKFDKDEFLDNNFIYKEINVVELNVFPREIVINEIMYSPQAPEPEWIELFNNTNKTIDITHFIIADSKDSTTLDTSGVSIEAGEYVLIAKNNLVDSIYSLEGKIIYSPFPLLNNSEDEIVLMDSLGRVIDSVKYYSSWGGSGSSIERIDSHGSSNDSSNWNESVDIAGATPLKINSVSQKIVDVQIDTVFISPDIPYIGDDISITAVIFNAGKNTAEFILKIYDQNINDTLNRALIYTSEYVVIDSGETYNLTVNNLKKNVRQSHNFTIIAVCDGDQDTTNNKYSFAFIPSYQHNKISINEFLIYPSAGEPEWIELQNISNDTINLCNWSVTDIITAPKTVTITDSNFLLSPNEYLVISKDSSLFDFHREIPSKVIITEFANMNNDEDGIVIKDANGKTIDSLYYSSDWEITKGYSNEKIDRSGSSSSQSNWGASIDLEQSTPGRINSIALKSRDVIITDIYSLPRFPAEGDSVNLAVALVNKGAEAIDNISVFLTVKNNSRQDVFDSIFVSSIQAYDSTIIVTSNKFVMNDSIKILATANSVNDEDPFNNFYQTVLYSGYTKGMIAISEMMISPKKGNAEWIEFVNLSDISVNLKGATITDLIPSPKESIIKQTDFFIDPGEYFVVASDTLHTPIENILIVNFGSLNTSSDGILLKDFRGSLIDSVLYNRDFFIVEGRSTERLNLQTLPNSPENWYPSVSPKGNTMGEPNSIAQLSPAADAKLVINEIMYDPDAGNSEFIEIFNAGEDDVELGGCALIKGDSNYIEVSPTFKTITPGSFFVLAADSNLLQHYNLNRNSGFINITKYTLPNEPTKLKLVDFFNNTIDSVCYSPKWHSRHILITKGRSLEKIDPTHNSNASENWGTSVSPEGATPLVVNSIFTGKSKTVESLTFSNNPFSPDGDGFEDYTIISYSLNSKTAQIRLRLFDDKGRLVRTIADHKPSASKGEVVFDGMNDSGRPLRIGMYIVLLEALSENGNVLEVQKKVLVIATKF